MHVGEDGGGGGLGRDISVLDLKDISLQRRRGKTRKGLRCSNKEKKKRSQD